MDKVAHANKHKQPNRPMKDVPSKPIDETNRKSMDGELAQDLETPNPDAIKKSTSEIKPKQKSEMTIMNRFC